MPKCNVTKLVSYLCEVCRSCRLQYLDEQKLCSLLALLLIVLLPPAQTGSLVSQQFLYQQPQRGAIMYPASAQAFVYITDTSLTLPETSMMHMDWG